MRPSGQPSVRWLYARLARHIMHSARVLHQPESNRNRQFRHELYQRRFGESKILLMNYLNHLSSERFISSQMFEYLYNHALELIENIRSQDYDYVLGAIEGIFDSMYPHDEL